MGKGAIIKSLRIWDPCQSKLFEIIFDVMNSVMINC